MIKKYIALFQLIAFSLTFNFAGEKPKSNSKDYLSYVETFADNLLQHGLDTYGSRNTSMWASIIDSRDFSVPKYGVPATKGTRAHDRAQGGSNLYHDVTTIKVFFALSDILNHDKYKQAVDAYLTDYLEYAQSPYNGLLGWGEHLYYHFYNDSVMLDEKRTLAKGAAYYPHELLGWTPPWDLLWQINSEKTQKAITGLKYHYNGPDPKVYLFSRHANYFKAEHQDYVMPWIKHAGLFSYSHAYLYNKTGDANALYWSKETGNLYWKLRDPETNLTLGCLFHDSKASAGKYSSISGTGQLAYWLYKAHELTGDKEQKRWSLDLMAALDKYHWDNQKQGYYGMLPLNGSVPTGVALATAWKIGYGSSSILNFGRVAAYVAKKENNPHYLIMARRVAKIINRDELPKQFSAQNIADVMSINLDLYNLTHETPYLNTAEIFAQLAIDELWKNGLFVRQNNDPYYEAKLAIGDLLAGFLRLHLIHHPEIKLSKTYDWSF